MHERIFSITEDILGFKTDENTDFKDVGSLKLLQIIMALDEENISVPLDKISKIKNMSDLLKNIEQV